MYIAITARPTPNTYRIEIVHCQHNNQAISGTIDGKFVISVAKDKIIEHSPVHSLCEFDGEALGRSLYLRYQDNLPRPVTSGHFVLNGHTSQKALTGLWSGTLDKQMRTALSIWLRLDQLPSPSPDRESLLKRIEKLFKTEKDLIESAKMNSDRIRLRLGTAAAGS